MGRRCGRRVLCFGWLSPELRVYLLWLSMGHVPALEASRIGWDALRDTVRWWDIRSREGLAEWMDGKRFVRPRREEHFTGRSQETVLNTVVDPKQRGAPSPPLLPPRFFEYEPETPVELDNSSFIDSLWSSPRGSSAGPDVTCARMNICDVGRE